MSVPTLEDKIRGCLIGAAIGAELGFSKLAKPENFAATGPSSIFDVKLEPAFDAVEDTGRIWKSNSRPFIDVGIRAYLEKQGRVTPEEFGELFKDDPGIAKPVFFWDEMHTIQELLKEGMNPRISGLGVAPSGHVSAAMLGVGIFHFADPEYAYVDGVELASVATSRLAADWAALTAAAVACALDPAADADRIVDTVMKIAHRADHDLFYMMNNPLRESGWMPEEQFLEWWYYTGGRTDLTKEKAWPAYNPLSYLLPLLRRYAHEPRKLMAVLLAPPSNGEQTTPILAGAIAGAMYGTGVFPKEWTEWAETIARPWFGMAEVARKRQNTEREIVRCLDRLAEPTPTGESLLYDKVYGCILAGAIGNAMGSPVECQSYQEIDEKHPNGITTVLEPQRLESEDDNQMAALLMETYIERVGRPVTARHFGHTWQERLNRHHFHPHCMGNSYDLIRKGWDPRITGHWNTVTGSTVMCMEPVGIFHVADPEFAYIDATAVSYMYQRGLDVTAAAILAAAVAEALKPDATATSVGEAALAASPKKKMITFDKRAFESPYDYIAKCLEIAAKYDDVFDVRAELYEKCLLYHPIDPLELLGFSFAMLKISDGDVRLASIGGTNIGRDSDTIAGRAAMLAGTIRGAGSVPQEWIGLFPPAALERIQRNAARLTDLVMTKRGALLRYRSDVA